jgi:hypothetical protein
MSVFKARELLVQGWSVNGFWLVLDHDQDAQTYRVEVHSAAGWEWGTPLPYTARPDADLARSAVLQVGAKRALILGGLCDSAKVLRPSALVQARLAARHTPLVAERACADLDTRTGSTHGGRVPAVECGGVAA